jgi:transposase
LPQDLARRLALRQSATHPVLNEFHSQLQIWGATHSPSARSAKQCSTLHQWTALRPYLDDAKLAIDNNTTERDLRAIAVGRKDWAVLRQRAAATLPPEVPPQRGRPPNW